MAARSFSQLWGETAELVNRARGDDSFRDEGVDLGTHTKATSPDGNVAISFLNRYGLTNGDFEGHLIRAVINNLPHTTAHIMHREKMKSDPGYAERYREEVLRQRRMGK